MPKSPEVRYRELASEHFATLGYERLTLSHAQFWQLIAAFRWTEDPEDCSAEAARANASLSLREAIAVSMRFNEEVARLADDAAAALTKVDADDLWVAAEHVIALGRAARDAALANPATLLERARARDYRNDVARALSHEAWVADVGLDELDAALREGSVIRNGWFDEEDRVGVGAHELIEHPEHGLGFVVLRRYTTRVDSCFLTTCLSGRRHDRPERSITLVRPADAEDNDDDDDDDDDDERPRFWYAAIGGSGPTLDIYVSEGILGAAEHRRVYRPQLRAQAYERFEALIADARARGFAERERGLERICVALQLQEHGLDHDAQVRREVLARATRGLVESGVGGFDSRVHVSRDATTMFFGVWDELRGGEVLSAAATSMDLDCLSPCVATIRSAGPQAISWGPTGPCANLELDPPFFAKLSITPDAETEANAVALAREAERKWDLDGSIDTLSQIDVILEAIHARGEDEAIPMLGAYVGETLREAIGGTWGVGSLYTHRIPFGLELGERRLRWWPMRDVREVIDGRLAARLSIRCHRVAQRARSSSGRLPGEDRRFCLAPHQGYFDAGVTVDGRQILMAAFYTGTFAYTFDAAGRLLEYMRRPELPGRPAGQPEQGPSRMTLELWQRELDFRPRAIHIRAFSGVDEQVGIEILPSHYRDFLDDPEGSEPDPVERERTLSEIHRWLDDGAFVLYWGNDLWLDREGRVISS